MSGSVTILTGPAGAGKSTVARVLAASLELSVHLHTDDFWDFISAGAILPYLPGSDAQNHTVLEATAAAAFAYAEGGYDVVADGVVGPWMLDHYRDAAREHPGIPLRYVVLRPPLDATLERARSRTAANALTDADVVADLWGRFTELGVLERHAIDTTALDVDQTVAAVRSALASPEYVIR
ncbi:AAA family ATPase [Microbacterium sp. Root180]|uniref:AAA family ATPase n=1 Tax=Microbacterium sp. Root180 TaxID=1736483 RepID=UPI000700D7A4|nr:AAA family ATPase [Microbacterium sp. Root180]KRB38690.1 shikimate kinase [Microbacterium sp. Root180]